jgi:hypothetical protein
MLWKCSRACRLFAGWVQTATRAAGGCGQTGVLLLPGAPAGRRACTHPAEEHAIDRVLAVALPHFYITFVSPYITFTSLLHHFPFFLDKHGLQ